MQGFKIWRLRIIPRINWTGDDDENVKLVSRCKECFLFTSALVCGTQLEITTTQRGWGEGCAGNDVG